MQPLPIRQGRQAAIRQQEGAYTLPDLAWQGVPAATRDRFAGKPIRTSVRGKGTRATIYQLVMAAASAFVHSFIH